MRINENKGAKKTASSEVIKVFASKTNPFKKGSLSLIMNLIWSEIGCTSLFDQLMS